MRHKRVITVALAVLGILLHASTAFSEVTSKDVEVLLYYNAGGYTVDYVQLFWKKDGVEKHKKWKGDLMVGQGFCARLSQVDGLQQGSEVWLKFKIAGGDKESCRKSQKMIFKKDTSQDLIQSYYSKGTTLNGNRCRKATPSHDILADSSATHLGAKTDATGNCNYSNFILFD